jgi:hypothetical protein
MEARRIKNKAQRERRTARIAEKRSGLVEVVVVDDKAE